MRLSGEGIISEQVWKIEQSWKIRLRKVWKPLPLSGQEDKDGLSPVLFASEHCVTKRIEHETRCITTPFSPKFLIEADDPIPINKLCAY